jgi:membrane protease YdiL (CAAX protease family)
LTDPNSPGDAPAIPPGPPPSRPLSLTRFTIEGRRAPGLFVVGWLAIVVAVGLASVAFLGAAGTVGAILWFGSFLAAAFGLVLLGGSETIERQSLVSYRGPSPLVVLFAVVVILQLAAYAVGIPLSMVAASIPRPLGNLIAALVSAFVFIGVVRLMVVAPRALSWGEMGLHSRGMEAVRELLRGAVVVGPVFVVTVVLTIVLVAHVGQAPPSPLPPTGSAVGLLLNLLIGAVLAPVSEEILFRGFALTAWHRLAGARAALIRTTAVFVLAHVLLVSGETFRDSAAQAIVGGVGRIPIALALGWVYLRTGSLWSAIGLHAAYNAILVVLAEVAIPQSP